MEEIVKALQEIVGAENVSNAKPIVEAYVARAIMDTSSKKPAIVVRPKVSKKSKLCPFCGTQPNPTP